MGAGSGLRRGVAASAGRGLRPPPRRGGRGAVSSRGGRVRATHVCPPHVWRGTLHGRRPARYGRGSRAPGSPPALLVHARERSRGARSGERSRRARGLTRWPLRAARSPRAQSPGGARRPEERTRGGARSGNRAFSGRSRSLATPRSGARGRRERLDARGWRGATEGDGRDASFSSLPLLRTSSSCSSSKRFEMTASS